MIRKACIAALFVALAASAASVTAQDRRATRLDANGNLDAPIARHAAGLSAPGAGRQ